MENLMQVKISVIIPVYNTEKYLIRSIQSVLNQDFKDFEIICVDDGSTDNSISILQKIANTDSRIRVIQQIHGGTSKARNAGIRLAKGQYIYFLDSDDYIKPGMFDKLYDLMQQNQLDIAYFDVELSFESEELRRGMNSSIHQFKYKYEGVYEGTDLFCEFVQHDEAWVSVAWQLWSREFLLRNNLYFYEGINYEDVLFVFKAMLNANRVMCVNDVYYIYRNRYNSTMTSDKKEQRLQGLFIAYCEILKYWEQHDYAMSVNVCIDKYATSWLGKIRRLSDRIHPTKELQCGSNVERYVYRVLILQKHRGELIETISREHMELIQRADKIIIYGSGAVAQEAIKLLQKENVNIEYIVISENQKREKKLFGIDIKLITELPQEYKDGLIVVAVRSNAKKEIEKNLIRLKFKNYIFL